MSAPRRSIYRQFAQHLLTPLIVMLLLATVAVILISYQHQLSTQRTQRQQLIGAYANSLLKPLWDCDDMAAQGIADSIIQYEGIRGVAVHSACTDNKVQSGEIPETCTVDISVADDAADITSHYYKELVYKDAMKRNFVVGNIHILFHDTSIYKEAFNALWPYLLIISAMALAIALGSMLAFRIIISHPLADFRAAINARIPAREHESLTVTLPFSKRNDELTDVVKSYDVLMDILQDQKQKLQQQARRDPLTGLGNRIVLEETLTSAIDRAHRNEATGYVLLFDLDGFKPINDTLGHVAGDYVLQNVARRLQGSIRATDTVVRLGGDEFVVVIEAQRPPSNLARILEKISQSLSAPLEYQGHAIAVRASVGTSRFPDEGIECETLLKLADKSMYADKLRKNCAR